MSNIIQRVLSRALLIFVVGVSWGSAQTVTGVVKLTDATGTEVLNYSSGDTLYVKVTDSDRDVDNLIADTVSVQVVSSFETTSESLVLTETDLSSGVFRGWMLFDEVSGLPVTDGVLQVERGNKLTVTYRDPADDFGNVSSVTDNAFYGVSLASGAITVNTTWEKAKSPYLVTGDVTVNSGVTLSIEPGVQVRFQPISDDQSGGDDLNRSELRVAGILRAIGTATDSIVFTSNAEVPAAGDWYGIRVYDSGSKVIMKYSQVEYHVYGVRASGYASSTDTIRVEHSRFRSGGTALYSSEYNDNRLIMFNHNVVVGTDGINWNRSFSYAEVRGNTITNGQIRLTESCCSSTDSVVVVDNVIKGSNGVINVRYVNARISGNTLRNVGSGITLDAHSNMSSSWAVVQNNTIDSTQYTSLQVTNYQSVVIRDNSFKRFALSSSSESYAGIYTSNGNRSSSIRITGNTITNGNSWGMYLNRTVGVIDSNQVTNNQLGGVYLWGDFNNPSLDSIRYNTITGNSGDGIQNNSYSRPVVNYNNHHSNTGYDLRNNTARTIYSELNAKYNWWGTTTTNSMDAGGNPKNITKIYDYYDSDSLGFVNYGGWLNAAWPGGTPTAVTATGVVKLTDRVGTEVLNYSSGDSLYVQVTDSDRDVDNLIADTVSVQVVSSFETTSESLVLTETDLSSGVFRGWMLFDEVSGLPVTDGVLQVERGNKLTVTYRDPADDFGNVSSVTDNAFYGVSLASGAITVNTTWEKAKSPYLVTGDVTVNSGVTLSIEPGVQVRFQPISDDQSGGDDLNRSELRVAGILRAIGTATDSIVFTSNAEVPAAGDWYGIRVYDSGSKVIMKYSQVEYHVYGVRASGYASSTDTIRVEHSRFRSGGTALYSSEYNDNRLIMFNHNVVVGTDGINWNRSFSYAEVRGNTITNGQIRLTESCCSSTDSVVVVDNVIKGSNGVINVRYVNARISGNTLRNVGSGITLDAHSNMSSSWAVVQNNTIDSTQYTSLQVTNYQSVVIRDNSFKRFALSSSSESYAGIYTSNGNRSSSIRITGNTITNGNSWGMYLNRTVGVIDSNQVTNNQLGGVYLWGDFNNPSLDSIRYNTITGNSGDGIQNNSYSRPVVNYNNHHSNTGYDLRNNTARTIYSELNAKYNWWGTTTTNSMDAGGNPKNITKIYDYYDSDSLGFVNYGQWLKKEVNITDIAPPSTITDLRTTNPTSNTIDLVWTAPSDDGPTRKASSYDVRHSTSTITDNNWSSATQVTANVPTPGSAGTSEQMTVTRLSPSTVYYFAIKSIDAAGNISALSNVASDTTAPPDTIAPASISDLSIFASTARALTIQWTAPGDDGTIGTAFEYDVRHSTSGIDENNFSNATKAVSGVPRPDTAGTVEKMTIDGLGPSTTYYVAMKTLDEAANESPLSNIATGVTTGVPVLSATSIWPKFHRDLQNRGSTTISGAVVDSLLWRYQTGNVINSSPTVDSAGVIYFGSEDGKVYALNPDGSLKWSYPTGGGVSAAPLITTMNRLYVGSKNNTFYAFNSETGDTVWTYRTGGQIISSATVDSAGRIYVGSIDGNLYCLDTETRKLYWKLNIGTRIYSSPALSLDDSTVYVGGYDRKVYAVNTNTGKERWSYATGEAIYGSSAVDSTGVVYIGSSDGRLYALNPDGTLKWVYSAGGSIFYSSPAIGFSANIYVGSDDDKLHAIRRSDGTGQWTYATQGDVRNSPGIAGNGLIYFSSADSKVYAVTIGGELKWSHQLDGQVQLSSVAIGPNGEIYVGTYDRYLYAIGILRGIPPAAPQNLAAESGDGVVTLSWSANVETDLAYYIIYRSETENFTAQPSDSIAKVNQPDTTYTDESVVNGLSYYYKISAVDTAGNESRYSNEVSASPVGPSLSVTPDSLKFGSDITTLNIYIQNIALGTLSWQISEDIPWLTASPTSGTIQPLNLTTNTTETADRRSPLWRKGDKLTMAEHRDRIEASGEEVHKVSSSGFISSTERGQIKRGREPLGGTDLWHILSKGDRDIAARYRAVQFSSSEVDTVVVTVDRTGIDPGTYSGIINISSNGGDGSVWVGVDVVDITPPTAIALAPANGQIDVPINANLVITFSEDIAVGTGNVTIKNFSNNANFEVIDVTSNSVTISGAVATVNPGSNFGSYTRYYVLIDATAFDDLAGNDFAGISFKSTWNFTTSAVEDTASPSAISAVVKDGSADDVDYQNSLTTITANWSGFTDDVGVISYEWAIGTTSGGMDVQNWTAVGNVATATNSSLTLTEGQTYYISVRAKDGAGNLSDVVTSDGVKVDATEPTVGIVKDGSGADIDYQASKTTIEANWSGFGDEGSGIAFYQWAIGTTKGGTEIMTWSNEATSTSATKTDLSLFNGMTCYISVRASDVAGNTSSIATSDGVTVDVEAPTVGSVQDGLDKDLDWTNSSNTLSASWSGFSDTLSGIARYEYAIGSNPGGTDLTIWTDAGLDTSFARDDFALVSGIRYYVSVRAVDGVNNISDIAISDGVTVDGEPPTAGAVIDGETEDRDWTSDDSSFSASWSGFDDALSSIKRYEFCISTTAGDSDVVSWTDNDAQTTATLTGLSFSEGIVYYGNVRAYDMANNISDVASSDGIQVDITAPSVGNVNDGLSGNIAYSSSTDSASSNWSGFADAQSGISHYEVAIGSTPGGTDILDFTDAGSGDSFTMAGLSLIHGNTYYCSVRANDLVGNVSEVVSSDGFTVDVYPGPASVVLATPDSGSYLPLIGVSQIAIKFSEPIGDYDLALQSFLGFTLQYDELQSADSLIITFRDSLASLDTIQSLLKNVTDLSGQLSDEMTQSFHSALLADYTADLKVDVNDLSIFIDGWTNKDFSLELGPVTGEVPHFVPHPDTTFNLRDVMAFTRMWHWSHQQGSSLILARPLVGDEPDISQSGRNLIVSLPADASTGQIVFQYSATSTDIRVASEEITEERMLLIRKEAAVGQLLVDFGYFIDKNRKQVVFDTEYFTRNNSTMTLSYVFFEGDQQIISQGTKVIELRAIPESFALHQNYPNPFNPYTTILYDLPHDSRLTLVIYDILGRQVRTLVNKDKVAGYHSVLWNGKDRSGIPAAAGVYIYRINARGIEGKLYSKTRKMLLLQ